MNSLISYKYVSFTTQFYISISRDTAGQERFRTITTAYYRGAMGIMLVYDITDEKSFENIKNWIRNIEENASSDVEKMLLGNKCELNEKRQVHETPIFIFGERFDWDGAGGRGASEAQTCNSHKYIRLVKYLFVYSFKNIL